MPVNRKMMQSMKDQYGDKKGKEVYYAMEMQNKKNKMSMGGMPTHKMPDGTVMKGAKHGYMGGGMAKKKPMGYAHGGLACGASNPAERPMNKKGK